MATTPVPLGRPRRCDPAPELLDTEVAGLVITILSGDGTISVSPARCLSQAADDLDRLLPQLDTEAA
jgi:hypothetical protein